jgi:hypothetical protein
LQHLFLPVRDTPFGVKTSIHSGCYPAPRRGNRAGADLGTYGADRLIEPIYEAACDPSRWPGALQSMADATNSLCANYFVWCKDLSSVGFFAASQHYSGQETYRAHFSALDPRRKLMERTPEGGVLRCHEHIPEEFVEGSEFFQDFALKHGRRYLLAAHLVKTDARSALAGLHRNSSQGPFGDDELSVIEDLKPHLRRAAQINARLEEIEASRRTAEATLDQLSFGIMTVDGHGRVLTANCAAAGMLRLGDGLITRGGRLTTGSEGQAARFSESLRCATDPRDGSARRGATLFSRPPLRETGAATAHRASPREWRNRSRSPQPTHGAHPGHRSRAGRHRA